MADRYAELTAAGPGAWLARRLGLPRPVPLRRRETGAPLLSGPALVVGAAGAPRTGALRALLVEAGADVRTDLGGVPDDVRLGAIVLDATAVAAVADLEQVRALLAPAFRRLGPSGRLLLLGADPGAGGDVEAAAAQQALEGLSRSAGKEARAGATVNLVRVAGAADTAALASTVLFLLSARSAFVSGQVVAVGEAAAPAVSPTPLAGQAAVVTGAARGIGAAVAGVLAQAGAHVVAVDVPAAGADLAAVANRVRGTALQLDITAPDAPDRLVAHLLARHGGADVVVHNAGITRDRLLVNLDAARWASVLEVNLAAPLRLTRALLAADGALRPGARIVAVSSTSGLAGNRGQTNYAASKAGLAGAVRALAPQVARRGMTVNAVAPGFIETGMTARMPVGVRELGRRASSLAQGGLPVDVAETIAWLAEPASAGVTGQVVRVCGQSLVGA
jgi:3-oxoacyl-[acyl-carrier protein] reductase